MTDPADERVFVLGIRHHGPGSARSVVAELDRLKPAAVLIEGPADADPLLALAADPGMAPPVALLAYAPDEPRVSAFWPFAIFSPEWQALIWAAANRVPVRFCDLPAGMVLAGQRHEQAVKEEERQGTGDHDAGHSDAEQQHAGLQHAGHPDVEQQHAGHLHDDHLHDDHLHDDHLHDDHQDDDHQDDESLETEDDAVHRVEIDPIGELAAAAGYDDPERWWEDVIELRMNPGVPSASGEMPSPDHRVFTAIGEAMAELRAGRTGSAVEQRREAHMRQVLRATLKETDGSVFVICGAWHVPALTAPLPPASKDAALLRGVPKRKAALAWVPWTHSRLAAASGYGAGITSPGWYHHLFAAPEQTVARWLTRVAGVLRDHDIPVSSAHIIEAVRLAETLAIMRGRPVAGLAEVGEATKSVMCDGDDLAAAFVTRDLVVGEVLGMVPDHAPPVPLDADLRARARALKLKIEPLARTLALDLRKETDRGRSVFLHRLGVLGIGWGEATADLVRGAGTFHETWTLCWRPELAVAIIDAAIWGTTVESAATAKIVSGASPGAPLADVTRAVEHVLLAELPEALEPVLRAMDVSAATESDVTRLMAAVPSLVRAVRYGDVRGTDTAALSAVVDALTVRVCAGLPAAVGSLADDAASVLRDALDGMHAALALHAQGTLGAHARDRWMTALSGLDGRRDVHGLVAGRIVRLLADGGVLSPPEAARRFAAALSVGVQAADKAHWAQGFLSGSGLLLAHDRDLLGILDGWLESLSEQEFLDVLPLLRRTFGEFAAPERSSIDRAVRHLSGGGRSPGSAGPQGDRVDGADEIDAARAAGALRTVAMILAGTLERAQ
jgi:hypothetical protein